MDPTSEAARAGIIHYVEGNPKITVTVGVDAGDGGYTFDYSDTDTLGNYSCFPPQEVRVGVKISSDGTIRRIDEDTSGELLGSGSVVSNAIGDFFLGRLRRSTEKPVSPLGVAMSRSRTFGSLALAGVPKIKV